MLPKDVLAGITEFSKTISKTVGFVDTPAMAFLLALYERNAKLFYSVAIDGVGDNAPQGAKNIELLARRLRPITQQSFRVTGEGQNGQIIVGDDVISFYDADVGRVRRMCEYLSTGQMSDSAGGARGKKVRPTASRAYAKYRELAIG